MINSLYELSIRRYAIKKEIRKSEKKLQGLWDDVFHEKVAVKSSSPTQKVLGILSNSSVIIDGALLGWKLYNRFGRKKR